jgi:hypothetical protein
LTPIPKHIDQKDTELQVSLTSPFHFRVKAEEQSQVKDFFYRKAGIFSRLHLCFLGKKEAFTPKEVSIRVKRSKHFREMLTSFLNISICFGRLHIL